MKTIFKALIIILSLPLTSQELFSVKFKIKNEGQNITKLEAQAASYSNRLIRNHAFVAFLSPEEINENIKNCWKKFLVNKSVKIEIKKSKVKQVSINDKYFTYQTSFNPKNINVTNISPNRFRRFCKIN